MMNTIVRKIIIVLTVVMLMLAVSATVFADELKTKFDQQVFAWAQQCRQEVKEQFDMLLSSGQLSVGQLFDTFYIPVPKTYPQKYRTQYDKIADEVLRPIIDKYLKKDKRLVFFIAVDRNGYVSTHNGCYAQPLTGDPDVDSVKNRTKRIFNDRTGLAAARNKDVYLLQHYSRDTGEFMSDLSVPLFINNRHWGAVRIGYRKK